MPARYLPGYLPPHTLTLRGVLGPSSLITGTSEFV